jgi:hypothetical protein
MPFVGRVIETNYMGDGTIEDLVRVDAPTESVAKRQARRAALRSNGYADVVLQSPSWDIDVEVTDTQEINFVPYRRRFIVRVVTTGSGEYFKG